jgi:hypothetical protein
VLRLWQALACGSVLVAIGAAVGVANGDVKEQFGEHGLITKLSVILIVACAGVAWSVFRRRGGVLQRGAWREPRFLWALVAAGFGFFALDERFKLHESLDHRVHDLLAIEETAVTDRIDDLVVGAYGLIGLAVLAAYRTELRLSRPLIPFLVLAFVLFFTTVAFDVMTNRGEVWLPWGFQLSVIEDAVKILSECLFLAGFCNTSVDVARKGLVARRAGA